MSWIVRKLTEHSRILLWVGVLVWVGMIAIPTRAAGPNHNQSNIDPQKDADQMSEQPAFVPDQVVVRMRPGFGSGDVLGSGRVVGVAATLAHSSIMLLDLEPGTDVDSASAALESLESVEYAHPNYVVNRLHPVQGSYPFPDVDAVGEYAMQPASVNLQLAAAHLTATGAGVKIGVLDVGIDYDDATLSGSVTSGYDFVDDDASSFDEPGGLHSGHGTFVGGVLHLAAPDAEIVAYRIIDEHGNGDGHTLARAIERAVDDGCDVINLSLVLMNRHLAVRDAIEYAVSQNVLVVAAAGNQPEAGVLFPAGEPYAMAVGALNNAAQRASFSTIGSQLSVCAPGLDIYSTYQDDGFAWWSGTSFSTPFVAGLAALLMEQSPGSNVGTIQATIESTADDISAQNPGLDGMLGTGQVNYLAAVGATSPVETAWVLPDTVSFTHVSGTEYFAAPTLGAWLTSSNAPAFYFAEVTGPDSQFAWIVDSVGLTDDTVFVTLAPTHTPGTYYNHVLFHVDSVPEPAVLTVELNVVEDSLQVPSASVTPSVLNFTAPLGSEIMLSAATVVQSTNAPADFVAAVLSGGAQLTSLPDSTGTTPDSVLIQVDPARAPAAGVYVDTVAFFVNGVSNPVPLFVQVTITDSSSTGHDTAWVFPDTGLTIVTDDLDSLYGCVSIYSTNAPANYFVEPTSPPTFVWLQDSVGVTNDQVCFLSFASLPPGTYADTLLFWVDGVVNNPVSAIIRLIVPAPLTLPEIRIDTVSAASGTDVEVAIRAPIGGLPWGGFDFYLSFDHQAIQFVSGQPGDFLVNCGWEYFNPHFDPADSGKVRVVALADQNSPDTVEPTCFEPQPGDVLARLTFHVTDDSAAGCRVAPIRFWWDDCSDNGIATIMGDTFIIAGDGPYSVLDYTGADLTGTPNVGGPPWPCPSGSNEPLKGARFRDGAIQIDCGGSGGDSAWVIPDTLFFTYPEGFTATVLPSAWVHVFSSNAPATYSAVAWVQNPLPLYTIVQDSVGVTNDSLEILINPAGLPVATHVNYVLIYVDGMAEAVEVAVVLNIVADSLPPAPTVVGLNNYPNPFNPETEISFALDASSQVRLEVFNILGQSVAVLTDGPLAAGTHRVTWNGRDRRGRRVGSGVFFYRLTVGEETFIRKMLMLR